MSTKDAGTAGDLEIHLESGAFAAGELHVVAIDGREAIGELFAFDVHAECAHSGGPEAASLVGADATIVFVHDGAEGRRVHGMIAEVRDGMEGHSEHRALHLRLVPRAHRLALAQLQDVHVGQTVPEILRTKLAAMGLETDMELRLQGHHPRRDLVVQYGETDLAFVRRLAEHVGISVFFEHKDGKDVMVLTDDAVGFQPIEGAGAVPFQSSGKGKGVVALEALHRMVPSYFAVQDYDYGAPLLDLSSDHELATGHAGGVIEEGAHYQTPAEGQALARIRAEERRSAQMEYVGKSDQSAFAAGGRFTLEDHGELGHLDLLLVEVEHRARISAEGRTYTNTFRAVPGGHTYRPARVTPRPRIGGLVTGVIAAGPEGLSRRAPVDEHGRYRVRFLFDTTPRGAAAPSGPVRMLQNHAGEGYGTHFPLRAGTEVLIAFVNGDPDRPVIVGAVPNALKPSPVTSRNAASHQMRTASGVIMEMVDES